jgi:hypothetical protein
MDAVPLQLVYDGAGPVHWDGGVGALGLQDQAGVLHPGSPGAGGAVVFDFTLQVKSLDAATAVLVGDFAHGSPADRFLYRGWRNTTGGFAQRLNHAPAASALTRRTKLSTRSDDSSARVAADITSRAPSPSSGT